MSVSTTYVEKRTAKNRFFNQINIIINWKTVSNIINKHYTVGTSATGTPSTDGLLLFKMLLIGIWYDLSDRDVEDMVSENLSAMKFCGLQLENNVPDHTVLSRFRTKLTDQNAFEPLLNEINRQLEAHAIIVKSGCKIDATITESLRRPKKKTTFEIAEDRKEDEVSEGQVNKQSIDIEIIKKQESGVDTEARFIKKAEKTMFGYKMHASTDENGLVIALTTTPANLHDSKEFEKLIEKSSLPKGSSTYADKAYRSKENSKVLKDKNLRNRIHYKAVRGKSLTKWQKQFNKRVSTFRYTVERTFGSIQKWFGAGITRYVGLAKTNTQHLLESICYNLKRAPRLIIETEIRKQQTQQIGYQ